MNYILAQHADKINLLGRSCIDNGRIIMDMTASGFEFAANFSGDVTVYCEKSDAECKIGLIMDDFYGKMSTIDLPAGADKAHFEIGAKNRAHKIRIVKLSEYNHGSFAAMSVEFDGDFCERPTLPKLKFDFYGDSLTCGYGNLSPDRDAPASLAFEQNGYLTYCAYLSRYYRADMSVASASGYGIITACDGTDRTHRDFYDMVSPNRGIKYDFARVPDVIFINYGTNDSEYSKNTKTVRTFDELYTPLKAFTDDLRAHAPDAYFVFVSGVSGLMKHDGLIDIEQVYALLEKEYDKAVFITGMYTGQLGGNWHPNVDDHWRLAMDLSRKLHERIPEMF